ncbi:hypothetical protein [Marinobacter piscensis]|uniref:hypothetical protein n=1 Tax=Marinobacter piscensis TaxID=1562308 RepID=UPI001FE40A43|nr:hypothetical protein [Marinobacter piscensis]
MCPDCHRERPVPPDLEGGDDTRGQIFLPIGPKARYLNKDHTYANGTVYNQLQYMAEGGLLAGLPSDFQRIEKTPVFNDEVSLAALSADELNDAARAYLDINCAHCHRGSDLTLPADYAGPAGSNGVQLEYNRDFASDPWQSGRLVSVVPHENDRQSPQDAGACPEHPAP